MKTAIFVGFIIIWTAWRPVPLRAIEQNTSGREIINPMRPPVFHAEAQDSLSGLRPWRSFVQTYGDDWSVLWNEATGTPYLMNGTGLSMPTPLTTADSTAMGEYILDLLGPLLRISPSDFQLERSIQRSDHWYLTFAQQYKGLPVYSGELQLLVNNLGGAVRIRGSVYPDIDIPMEAEIDQEQALITAKATFGFDPETDQVIESKLMIFPFQQERGVEYHLVYAVTLLDWKSMGSWSYFVNARTGKVLHTRDNTHSQSMSGTVTGYIYPEYEIDSTLQKPWARGTVKVTPALRTSGATGLNDPDYFGSTNDAGYYDIRVSTSGEYFVRRDTLKGNHLTVLDASGDELSHEGLGDTWSDHNWVWNSAAYDPEKDDEVNVWYHATKIYSILLDSPFSFDLMNTDLFRNDPDGLMQAHVRVLAISCEARYREEFADILFGTRDDPCGTDVALDSDVIYHEYGHAIMHGIQGLSYKNSAAEYKAMHEGFSDYWACTINGDPNILEVVYPANQRTLQNTRRYEDFTYEPHLDGMIVGGGVWNMRVALGKAVADKLFFEALFGNAVWFSDYLDEVLIADDLYFGNGDGIVTTSTPHLDAVLYAFGDHGIYPSNPSVPPAAPKNVSLTPQGSSTLVSWVGNLENDFAEFKVYRKTDPDIYGYYKPIWRLIATTTSTSYLDSEFDMGAGSHTAWYKVRAKDNSGKYSNYSETVSTSGQIKPQKQAVVPNNSIPLNYQLKQNYPNPFNPVTTIKYDLPEESSVVLKVYDLMGHEVLTLVSGNVDAGYQSIVWDGKDSNGNPVSSGMYFYRLDAISKESDKEFHLARKMVLLR